MNETLKFEECFLDSVSADLEITTQKSKGITCYGKKSFIVSHISQKAYFSFNDLVSGSYRHNF